MKLRMYLAPPEPLSQPTDSIDGTWQLGWAIDGSTHQGKLTIDGDQGNLMVTATGQGAKKAIAFRKPCALWSSPRGLVLLGYNPIDPGTKAASTDYSPDNFLFEPQSDGTYAVTRCDDAQKLHRGHRDPAPVAEPLYCGRKVPPVSKAPSLPNDFNHFLVDRTDRSVIISTCGWLC